eukprot:CAMPEP_0179271960 /NCGR_PEP_ID=MMETSP0797-20121207/32248_1 /TAXON_ID=47934 /ORGANISM="Dinophysis acuminata, Strain DAEP01" /LENGTH=188 /DNA_ID=CAMNT_0020980335 /DNA_START=132 /DNA_END=698 /DNA_ORIENTATION=-
MSGTLRLNRGNGRCTASRQSSRSSNSPSLKSRTGPVRPARASCSGPASSKLLGSQTTSSSDVLNHAALSADQYLNPQQGCPSRPQTMQVTGAARIFSRTPPRIDLRAQVPHRVFASAVLGLTAAGDAAMLLRPLPSASPGFEEASILASACLTWRGYAAGDEVDSRPVAPHNHLAKAAVDGSHENLVL